MRIETRFWILATFELCMLASTLRAENWPQWRGPGMNGISTETSLPTEWSADKNIAWKTALAGLGGSSPVVWNDMVIVTSQIGDAPVSGGSAQPLLARDDSVLAQRENAMGGPRGRGSAPRRELFVVVEAFNRIDGKRLWEFRADVTGTLSENHEKHNLATPTPIIDADRIYAWFGSGQVFALDHSGKLIWKRHLGEEYGPFTNNWGHGSSPTLYNDLLILLCDHDSNAYLLALDKTTGKERWKVDRGRDRISHSTPFIVPGSRGPEMIINSSKRIDTYDPASGKLLWFADGERQTPIPTPVFYDGMIYLSRGYRNSDYLAIQPGGSGDVSATHIKWREPNAASYVPSILQYQGLLYMTNEVGVLTCADTKTGQRVWRHRLDGVFFASPVAGDGKIFMLSETGDMFILRAGPTAVVIAQNKLDERFIASPAISNGHIFLRGDRTLFSIGR
jgi:outer membrane protein assembly factor BamB